MSRVFNFYAGPATLPLPVLERAQAEFVEYRGIGMSLIETSHRSAEYDEVHNGAVQGIRELLAVPEGYSILLVGGGATLQFSMVPMNILPEGAACDFLVTGSWGKKALADTRAYGRVNVLFDGADHAYTTLPEASAVRSTPGAAYLHLTSNETIGGVQYHRWPTVEAPIVADMSSDILSRPIPTESFGLIYAGAQKNLGPAGVTIVIVRDDLVERSPDSLGAYLSYKTHAKKNSLYNTPPVFSIYLVRLVLDWIRDQGGVPGIEARNTRKANKLYDAIDNAPDFFRCPVDGAARSHMNVVFRLPSEELEAQFVSAAKAEGMVGLKGHRDVGGIRASIYNAMPEEGVEALVAFMTEFVRTQG